MQHKFSSRPRSFLGLITAMLFLLDFHHVQLNLYKWSRMWGPHHSSIHLSALANTHASHQVQGINACLQIYHRLSSLLISTRSYESTSLLEAYDHSMSDGLWYNHREPQNHSPEHLYSWFHAGGMISPPSPGMQNPWQHSKDNWKLISSLST